MVALLSRGGAHAYFSYANALIINALIYTASWINETKYKFRKSFVFPFLTLIHFQFWSIPCTVESLIIFVA